MEGSGLILDGRGLILDGSGLRSGRGYMHYIDLCLALQTTQLQAFKDKRLELAEAEQFVVVVSVVRVWSGEGVGGGGVLWSGEGMECYGVVRCGVVRV